MKKSIDYLKEAKEKLGVESDYALAKALKTNQQNISRYMAGGSVMDDYHCLVVAKALGIDPMRIIAAAQEEREKSEEKREVWRDFRQAREKQGGQALVPVMAILGSLMLITMTALPSVSSAGALANDYILCQICCYCGSWLVARGSWLVARGSWLVR
ncbi:hypothetical protein [Aquitalea aquatica]|uniref:Uncharacterized protein n=1 Tax=Aquitalea aquatica TaxID=3044273 RepID=A0A838YD74_9NEIS|nr:hypothetical protein [Aquitalea magnusonii]MBA4710469.1 hypothetical protein [Aquitalea magnusonii]